MSYKISGNTAKTIQNTIIPFYVKPQITYSAETGRISIMVGLKTENSKAPEQVAVKIPLPSRTTSCEVSCTLGTVSVCYSRQEAVWRIGKVKRDKPACLNATITMKKKEEDMQVAAAGEAGEDHLPSAKAKGTKISRKARLPSESPTFTVSFQLQQGLSGLEVDSMEVSNVKYKPYKGVRYITRSGYFQIRT